MSDWIGEHPELAFMVMMALVLGAFVGAVAIFAGDSESTYDCGPVIGGSGGIVCQPHHAPQVIVVTVTR